MHEIRQSESESGKADGERLFEVAWVEEDQYFFLAWAENREEALQRWQEHRQDGGCGELICRELRSGPFVEVRG